MRNEFNSYHWHKHKVNKREDVPIGPHFQVLLFGTRTEHTPAYDKWDPPGGTSHSVAHVDVYALKTREELDLFVSEAAQSSANFVFYHVGSLGKATVRVDVDTQLDDGTNPMHEIGYGRGD